MFFNLIVESRAADGSLGDRVLKKQVLNWPCVPRIGEQVTLDGNAAPVIGVDHDFDCVGPNVYTNVDDEEFDRLETVQGFERMH